MLECLAINATFGTDFPSEFQSWPNLCNMMYDASMQYDVKNYESLRSGYVGMFGHQCNIWHWFPIRISILTWSMQYNESFGRSNSMKMLEIMKNYEADMLECFTINATFGADFP